MTGSAKTEPHGREEESPGDPRSVATMVAETLPVAVMEHLLIDALVDAWSEQSFPASDPPGSLPPSLSLLHDLGVKAEHGASGPK
jgi:hypothetical protein